MLRASDLMDSTIAVLISESVVSNRDSIVVSTDWASELQRVFTFLYSAAMLV